MLVSLGSPIFQAFVAGTNAPLAGGKLWSYQPGTTNLKATYTDAGGITPNSNPVILDANGMAQVWLNGAYKLLLQDSNNVQQSGYPIDNYSLSPYQSTAPGVSEWILQTLTSLTYISATQFSCSSDMTPTFQMGRKVQATVSAGTITGTISASSYSLGVTTVTVSWDSGSLDSGISAISVGILAYQNPSLPMNAYWFTGDVKPTARTTVPIGWLLCDGTAYSRTTYAALFAAISTTWGAGDGSTTFNVPDFRSRGLIGAGTGAWAKTFTASNSGGSLLLTVPSNQTFYTGTPFVPSTTGTLPTGLSPSTTYYAIYVSGTTIKVATSLANAEAGTAIAWTDAGTGTHTATVTYSIRSLGDVGGEEVHASLTTEIQPHTHVATVTDPQHHHSMATVGNTTAPNDTIAAGAVTNNSVNSANSATGITVSNANTGGGLAHNNMQPFGVVNWLIKT